ncbi:hypothetical protein F4604DRAFT_1922339 [Suillus subluteus]|nr:hypothetical protein F4604DRAFT_1922339 [Suillus subluteus]
MDDVSHNFDVMGKTHCIPDWESDIAHVHLSLEKIQMESDEKMGRIEIDVSNVKHSLQHTTRNTDSASSRLQDLEDVVVSHQGHLENLLNDLRHQLNSVQEDVASAAFNAKLQHVESIDTIQSSVLAFHDFMEKSLDRHKAILQCSSSTNLDQHTDLSWGSVNITAHAHKDVLAEFERNLERDRDGSPTGNVVDDILQPLPGTARLARVALRMWTGAITVAWPTR